MSVFNVGTQKSYSHSLGKSLGVVRKPREAKSLDVADAAASPELTSWYEKAYQYYSAVMSGQEARPSDPAWQEFLGQMNWALGQMGGWDPMASSAGELPASPVAEAAVPEGARRVSANRLAWDTAQVDIPFQAENRTEDVWGREVNINVPSLAFELSEAAVTTDTRLQPPQQVLRIVLKDKISGKEETYMVNDYLDAAIKIRTPDGQSIDPKKIDALNSLKPGLITEEKYDPTATAPSAPSVSDPAPEMINGERVWKKGNAVNYFLTAGKEKDRIHLDAIDFNIPDRTYQVHVTKKGAHQYTVEVFDPSVSATEPIRTIETDQTDSINFKGIDAGNVLFKDDSIPQTPQPTDFTAWDQFAQSPDAQIALEGFVPSESAGGPSDRIAPKAGEKVNPKGANDTPTDAVDLTNHLATYKSTDSVELTVLQGPGSDAIQSSEISGAKEFILHKSSNSDQFTVTKTGENQYSIVVQTVDGTQTFKVSAQKITLDASLIPASNVQYVDQTVNPASTGNYLPGLDPNLFVNGETRPPTWPDDLLQNMPSSDNWEIAVKLGRAMNAAAKAAAKARTPEEKSAAWAGVLAEVQKMRSNDGTGNDAIRIVMTALDRCADKSTELENLDQLLDMIPEEVRTEMQNLVYQNDHERDEKHGDETWNSKDAYAILSKSLD